MFLYARRCYVSHLSDEICIILSACLLREKLKKLQHHMSWHYTGCFKKNFTLSFSLISLSIDMLEGWYISHLKGGIHSSVWSTKTFLYNIREPRYKQNDMGYKMSRIWYNQQSDYLEIWYCQDLCIISLAMNILGGCDTSKL